MQRFYDREESLRKQEIAKIQFTLEERLLSFEAALELGKLYKFAPVDSELRLC